MQTIVTVTTSATALTNAIEGTRLIRVTVPAGGSPVYLGESGVTAATGTRVTEDEPVEVEVDAKTAVYAVVGTGSQDVRVDEEHLSRLVLPARALSGASAPSAAFAVDSAATPNALGLRTTGTHDTAAGQSALAALTSGANNTAVGFWAGVALTTGNTNTLVGSAAGQALTTDANNVAIGANALATQTGGGSNNVAVGAQAMQNFNTNISGENVAVGPLAMQAQTTGIENVAIGSEAMLVSTTAAGNVGIGVNVLHALTTAASNVAVGANALASITTGAANVGIGTNSGVHSVVGHNNAFLGSNSGPGVGQDPSFATAIGDSAIVNGTAPTAVGVSATATANFATALGNGATASAAGAVAIGSDSGGGVVTSSTANLIVLGTTNHTTQIPGLPAFVSGDKYVVVDSTGKLHKSAIGPAS